MTSAYDLEALRVAVDTTQHALAALMTHDNPPELDEALHTLKLALYDFAAAVWPPTEPDPLAADLDAAAHFLARKFSVNPGKESRP